MTTEPSPEYVNRQLQLADEALDDARYLLEGSRMKAAANRAYYAMFYAAMASLIGITSRPPKTHRGTIALFGRHYVQTGKLDVQLERDFQDANLLRQERDYGMSTEVEEERVRETLLKAEAFLTEVKRLLNED